MATQERTSSGSIILRGEHGNEIFRVISFENGILVIDTLVCSSIYSLAQNIADCFEKNANLKDLRAIKFSYNGVQVSVSSSNAKPEKIVELWRESMNRKAQYKSRIENPIGYPNLIPEMQFKDENSKRFWKDYVKINAEDSYGFCIVCYAKKWAEFMQYLMGKNDGTTVADVAEQASKDASGGALTKLMRSYAIDLLGKVWKHGEELKKWDNKEYDYSGKDDVNPEMLTVSVG